MQPVRAAVTVERQQHRVGSLESFQPATGVRTLQHRVAERRRELLEHGRAHQEAAVGGRSELADHLGAQVVDDEAIGRRLGRVLERSERSQVQAGGPALGRSHDAGRLGGGQAGRRGAHHEARFPRAHRQIGRPDLHQALLRAHPCHRKRRIAAPGDRHGRPGRQLGRDLRQAAPATRGSAGRPRPPPAAAAHPSRCRAGCHRGPLRRSAQLARIGVIVTRCQPCSRARIPLRPLRQQRRLAVPGAAVTVTSGASQPASRLSSAVRGTSPSPNAGGRNLAPGRGASAPMAVRWDTCSFPSGR